MAGWEASSVPPPAVLRFLEQMALLVKDLFVDHPMMDIDEFLLDGSEYMEKKHDLLYDKCAGIVS